MTSLQHLFLHRNQITTLTNFGLYMPNVVKLTLDSNDITSVSASHLRGLVSLEQLSLADNLLTTIDLPSGMPALKSLNLTLNDQLNDVPDLANLWTLGSVTVYVPNDAIMCGTTQVVNAIHGIFKNGYFLVYVPL